jgi:hypothetical protein
VEATHGFVSFRETDKPSAAQVTVQFDPYTDGGHTTTRFRGSRLMAAKITVGVESDSAQDIGCTAAHEFGHALGLDGHSDVRSDLMYPVHRMRSRWGVTNGDLDMLATLYKASTAAADWTPTAGF